MAVIGKNTPTFTDMPKPEQRSAWDFRKPPILVPVQKKVEFRNQGVQLALPSTALELLKTASLPTYYLLPEDVVFGLWHLKKSAY